ncbi:UDP-glycosyltransferase 74B1-like [Ziziphus jujuba]|uniref:UDP-glycosyltransferase 74B1-like n=1 Tax=Ziziphus jujuba TaxID=326968 RepID=A0ABM3ZXA7_ZIZJJ|nr:UDP-glycosyltransferase 74B1-like [Ziziphus jujuba]
MDMEALVSKLRIEDDNRRSDRRSMKAAVKANVVEHRSSSKSQKKKPGMSSKLGPKGGISKKAKFQGKCFNYDKMGHRAAYCRLPKRKKNKEAQMMEHITREVDDIDLSAVVSEEAKAISNLWPGKLIGPMVPSAYLDGRIDGDKETKPQNSVVYVSFGSMVSLTQKQMEEIAFGLQESNFHFLWVVRESERDKLPNGFIDSAKEKGLIVGWCNQLEMLAHEAVGCFVTHCGWNSTLEGLSLGVPMVGMPQWADQFTDAKFVEEI